MTVPNAEHVKRLRFLGARLLKRLKETKTRSSYASDRADGVGRSSKKRVSRFKFCPKCGSSNIFWASGLAQLWSIWECRSCGYRGAFIVEDGDMAKMLQEEYAKKTTKQ